MDRSDNHSISYAMSDQDIKKVCPDCSILLYPQLKKFKNANDIFKKSNKVALLLLTTSPHSGHWLALMKKPDGIHYFDSYSNRIDYDLMKWLTPEERDKLKENEKYLTELLENSGQKIWYSQGHKYQSSGKEIATCGRHVATRLYNYNLSEKQYSDKIKKSGLNADNYVLEFTNQFI